MTYCELDCPNEGVLQDGSCIQSCPHPTINHTVNGIVYCKSPCNPNEHYLNGTCFATCPDRFNVTVDPISKILKCVACNGTDGVLPDDSCISTCPVGTHNISILGYYFCEGPCYYKKYSFNNSCLNSCNPPFLPSRYPINKILTCILCNGTEGALPDYTCVPECPAGTTNST